MSRPWRREGHSRARPGIGSPGLWSSLGPRVLFPPFRLSAQKIEQILLGFPERASNLALTHLLPRAETASRMGWSDSNCCQQIGGSPVVQKEEPLARAP
jgi:hypothetical protein